MRWLLLFGLLPLPALAHNPFTSGGQDQVAALLSAFLLLIFWGLYLWGSRRTPVKRGAFWLFHGTAVITFITMLGPLDDWAETSSAAHMTQHMLIMVVIAPLFAIAKPLPQIYAVGGQWLRTFWHAAFKITRFPMLCAYLHGFMIWFWHIPTFYMLAIENPWVHVFEHFCFLITAIWFWWACLYANREKSAFAFLALLFTLMHTGFLGALLTFGAEPFYGESRDLADQQLAGLIMWVLGGIPYILGSIWAGVRWYRQIGRTIVRSA
ncbi:cytochrome c oxidase assembly protein [Aliidiomarina sanyensis]|uniref:Cytochrome c oxidase assembly protein n=1 Tax=Aliidiomarina sanyensis TaxID=1249555 RepID=A0A432WKC2_9GAMM|nr:cytochrome c oxidase assembly protein [Aliidiomarina sanyensis]RUO34243.1 hypothetical protein CWE11_05815 [Aliidiomarina sanyensis]